MEDNGTNLWREGLAPLLVEEEEEDDCRGGQDTMLTSSARTGSSMLMSPEERRVFLLKLSSSLNGQKRCRYTKNSLNHKQEKNEIKAHSAVWVTDPDPDILQEPDHMNFPSLRTGFGLGTRYRYRLSRDLERKQETT